MLAGAEIREITVQGARSIWREQITDEEDLVKLIRLIEAELYARNVVNLVVIVGNPFTQIAIMEE